MNVDLQPREGTLTELNLIGNNVDEALVRLERFLDESLITEGGISFSGGQRRRLDVAMGIIGGLIYALRAKWPEARIVWSPVVDMRLVPALPAALGRLLEIRATLINRARSDAAPCTLNQSACSLTPERTTAPIAEADASMRGRTRCSSTRAMPTRSYAPVSGTDRRTVALNAPGHPSRRNALNVNRTWLRAGVPITLTLALGLAACSGGNGGVAINSLDGWWGDRYSWGRRALLTP